MWSRSAAFHPAALDRVPFPIVEGSDGRALGLELNLRKIEVCCVLRLRDSLN